VQYKVSAPYRPDLDRAIRFDDPSIGIEWPLPGEFILSDKDRGAPFLADVETGFD
jgi:dTDP-4-dehydrorhamnose 3,5-epimerase